jgi:hypothetical protein
MAYSIDISFVLKDRVIQGRVAAANPDIPKGCIPGRWPARPMKAS